MAMNPNKIKSISPAAQMIIPLLDAMHWEGNRHRLQLFMNQQAEDMSIDGLIDTMAALSYQHQHYGHLSGTALDERWLPVLIADGETYHLILNMNDQVCLTFSSVTGTFSQASLKSLKGEVYGFKYVGETGDSLLHEQTNWFRKLAFRFASAFRSLMVLSLIITLLDLMIPLFMVLIYDQIGNNTSIRTMIVLLIGVILYFSGAIIFDAYRRRITAYISTRMGNIISQQTFRKLMYLPPSYTELASTSAQINRIKDFENLKRFTNSGIFTNILELSYSVIYIAAISVMGGWLGLVPLVTFLVVILLGWLMQPLHREKAEQLAVANADRQQNLLEVLKNTRAIRTSGMKDRWILRSKDMIAKSILANYKHQRYVSLSNNIIYFVTNVSVLVLIYGGTLKAIDGQLSVGALIGMMLLYWRVLSSVRGASSLIVQINGLKKSVQQINRFMRLPQDTSLSSNMLTTKKTKGQVLFKDVSIRYTKASKAALVNLNFGVAPGEVFGITGHDGSGKTTILKLILGMYIPQGGRVIIDGYNLKQLEPLSLRQSISYCSEKDMIFTGPIIENFRALNPNIRDEDVMALAEMTGLKQYFDRYGIGLETILKQDQLDELSPSFKKVLSLTIALSRDVQLYLIDEPENHLNNNEIQWVIHIIKRLSMEGKTVIVTTKSQDILDYCDNTLTLNKGRGVEQGKGPVYA